MISGSNTKKEFLNVYNFMPLPEKKAEKYECQDEHTGVITYSITTKTPLFIPNTSSDHAFRMEKEVPVEHKSYDFYSYREMESYKTYDEEPAIPVLPGSELRGMVRGIYETLTNSCMGVLNEEVVPSLRTGEIFKAGLIYRYSEKKYGLVMAEKYRYCEGGDKFRRTYEKTKYHEGQKLYFKKLPHGKTKITDCKAEPTAEFACEGYLLKGMGDRSFGKKHNASIFKVKNEGVQVEKWLTNRDIERLKTVLQSYREQPNAEEDCYKEYSENLEKFLRGKGEKYFPVYYSIADKAKELLYLAPACITREVSHYNLGELAGEFAPCKSAESMCPACDLFGRVGKTNEDSHASKLRFADAYPEKCMEAKDYYMGVQPITLETLAEPKIGATEFYLYRPEEASYWTYDYYVLNNTVYPKKGVLRGRKYYWHQPGVKILSKNNKTNLNKTVRPVKEEVTFVGKVYFDKISQTQLNQIIWILNCGAENDELAYKLGAGKPLGLGSVECKIMEVTEREVDIVDEKPSYCERQYKPIIQDYDNLPFTQHCKKEFLLMSSFRATEKVPLISYPLTVEQLGESDREGLEGFEWFKQNHDPDRKKGNGNKKTKAINSRNKRVIHENLPSASTVETLPCGVRERTPGILTAEVTGYRPRKNGSIGFLELQIEGVGRRTIDCSEIKRKENVPGGNWEASFPLGTKIQVAKIGQKPGKNGKMYDVLQYKGRI